MCWRSVGTVVFTRVEIVKTAKRMFQQQACLLSLLLAVVVGVQCESKNPLSFSDIFPRRLGNFSPNFACLLHDPIYAELQIFIQLSATLTKLCHIKRDHHHMLKMFTFGRNAHWVVALNMA